MNNPIEYFHYVEDEKNGLFIKKNIKDYTFTLQYKPTDYMILSDNENLPIDKKCFVRDEEEYNQFQFYTLRIKVAADTQQMDLLNYNLTSEEEYNERLHYFETSMQKDVKLICGQDTASASFFQFEKETTTDAYSSFLISFPAPLYDGKDRIFMFDDRILKTGKVIFIINGEAISNTPSLNL